MLPRYRSLLAIFALVFGFITPNFTYSASAIDKDCRQVLTEPTRGVEAINKLGLEFTYVATLNNRTTKQLENLLLNSPQFYIDQCGHGYFADTTSVAKELPLPGALEVLPTGLVNGNGNGARPIIDASQVFKLHSNPTSKKTFYLNFKGKLISGTAWNVNYNNNLDWFAPGFSQDSNYKDFTKSELEVIQSVWQRVAEDFVAFDIDVTTEEPSRARIERANASDYEYGTEILISADTVIFNACKCSGLAYLSSFDMLGSEHNANQPAWVFTQGVGDNPKYIAESITHELGHTVGLSHDGTTSSAYFAGASGWAPIMGVGFYQPITQWSKGDYPAANNTEDEYEVMAAHGLSLRADEDKNSFESARNLNFGQKIGGVISTPNDQDYFVFTVPSTGEFTVSAVPATFSPNLDIELVIYESNNNKIVSSNPPIKMINNDVADGMSASATVKFAMNKKYYAVISGTQVNSDVNKSKYGSIGTYQITLGSKAIVQLSVLPTTNSSPSSSNQNTNNNDISNKLITPVTGDNAQPLLLPNGTTSILIYKFKNMQIRTGMFVL